MGVDLNSGSSRNESVFDRAVNDRLCLECYNWIPESIQKAETMSALRCIDEDVSLADSMSSKSAISCI